MLKINYPLKIQAKEGEEIINNSIELDKVLTCMLNYANYKSMAYGTYEVTVSNGVGRPFILSLSKHVKRFGLQNTQCSILMTEPEAKGVKWVVNNGLITPDLNDERSYNYMHGLYKRFNLLDTFIGIHRYDIYEHKTQSVKELFNLNKELPKYAVIIDLEAPIYTGRDGSFAVRGKRRL